MTRSGVDQQRATLRASSAVIADLVDVEPGREVPACPGWTLADLAEHVLEVQRWATGVVRTLPVERPERGQRERRQGPVAERLRAVTADLDEALAAADPGAACWGFGPRRDVAFWARRQAQEALVHHHDALDAVGQIVDLDPAACAEGIDEYLEVFVGRWGAKAGDWLGDGETCHLHATDTEGEWHLALQADAAPTVTRQHATGDVAVRGPAAHLLLGTWRRRPMDDLQWFGAPDDVARWQQRLTSLHI